MAEVTSWQKAVLYLRSSLYWIVLIISTILVGICIISGIILPYKARYNMGRTWAEVNLKALKWICGLDFEIKGFENVTPESMILFAKHQSTYECMVIIRHFPRIAWVVKRELLWVPMFGWSLALIKPTPIDRKSGGKAIDQIVKQGGKSLDEGRWVTIFPEGTRKAPGSKPNYRIGGAILASKTGYPIIPLAHNSGEFWPKHSFIKWPGKVTFVVGEKISPKGKEPEEILNEAKTWIESQMDEISDPNRWSR